jgi:hypothetical protein
MKTITSAVLGLSLTLASAGLTFAQTAPAATDNPAPVAKKHVKKTKKTVKSSSATASNTATPAPAAAPASK